MYAVSIGGSRTLETFNIPPAILSKLVGAGFQKQDDFTDLQPSDIVREVGLTLQEAAQILGEVQNKQEPRKKTALDILEQEKASSVNTFVRRLDEMLGSGVEMGKVTEFCGAPGLGKTQLGIQLAVDVHLPSYFDGASGHCIYIDTEGSFMPQRVAAIADSFVKKVESMVQGHKSQFSEKDEEEIGKLSVEHILKTIYYYRVHNYVEQIALIHILRDKIKTELQHVKLIVVDSVAFHFRRNFEDYAMRTRLLGNMSQTLIEIAKEFNLAVVLMNQVTTRFVKGQAELVPALGETWGHSSTNRVMLFERKGVRFARLLKSPNRKKGEVPYTITEEGVRDYDMEQEEKEEKEEENEEQMDCSD